MNDDLGYETRTYPFTTDAGAAAHAALGLISLTSDHVVEDEMHRICDRPGVATYTTRIPNAPNVTPDTLADMAGRITETARLILPYGRLDVLAYACTSATVVIGEEEVFRLIREAKPEAIATTPITAAKAAFKALNAQRIAVLTPYRADVNAVIGRHLLEHGFEIPVFGTFLEESDEIVSRIDSGSLRKAVIDMVKETGPDAIFVSCTSTRLIDQVCALEREIGLPVTSSNHALIWHALRLAGINDAEPRWGKLFERPLA